MHDPVYKITIDNGEEYNMSQHMHMRNVYVPQGHPTPIQGQGHPAQGYDTLPPTTTDAGPISVRPIIAPPPSYAAATEQRIEQPTEPPVEQPTKQSLPKTVQCCLILWKAILCLTFCLVCPPLNGLGCYFLHLASKDAKTRNFTRYKRMLSLAVTCVFVNLVVIPAIVVMVIFLSE